MNYISAYHTHCTDQIVIAVDCTAGASNTVLSEESATVEDARQKRPPAVD